MKTPISIALALSTALALAQYTPTVPIDNRTLPQIYAAARHERSSNTTRPLQVFWGGDAGSQGDGFRKAWAQQFPDIPLNLTVMLSKYGDVRLDEAFYRGDELPAADVVSFQTLQDFPRWKGQNRLMFYKPSSFEDILVDEKDADGAFMVWAICELSSYMVLHWECGLLTCVVVRFVWNTALRQHQSLA